MEKKSLTAQMALIHVYQICHHSVLSYRVCTVDIQPLPYSIENYCHISVSVLVSGLNQKDRFGRTLPQTMKERLN